MQKVQYYMSDISYSQFELILPILESAKKRTKPRKIHLYDVFCAILYVIKGGIQWRLLPSNFPKWQLVYMYFKIWSERKGKKPSILEIALKKIVQETRVKNNKKPKTSFGIIDAQSVKNTDTAEKKGYDAGKKVSGIKRHIVVDTNGIPHGIYVTTANITDRDGAIELVKGNKKFYLKWKSFSAMEVTRDLILLAKLRKLMEQM